MQELVNDLTAPVKKVVHYAPIFSVKLVRDGRVPYETIRCPADAGIICRYFFEEADRETLLCLMLDTKNKVLGVNVVSVGILDSSLVHPREVFKPAILISAAAIILCHNHPSGDPTPSSEDKRITQRIAEAGQVIGIELLDHIVWGISGQVSLKERGLL